MSCTFDYNVPPENPLLIGILYVLHRTLKCCNFRKQVVKGANISFTFIFFCAQTSVLTNKYAWYIQFQFAIWDYRSNWNLILLHSALKYYDLGKRVVEDVHMTLDDIQSVKYGDPYKIRLNIDNRPVHVLLSRFYPNFIKIFYRLFQLKSSNKRCQFTILSIFSLG